MTISIRGARVIDPASGLDQVGDLHIEAGKIEIVEPTVLVCHPTTQVHAGSLQLEVDHRRTHEHFQSR